MCRCYGGATTLLLSYVDVVTSQQSLDCRIIAAFCFPRSSQRKCAADWRTKDQRQKTPRPNGCCVLQPTSNITSRENPSYTNKQCQRQRSRESSGGRRRLCPPLTLRCVLIANCWNDLELANRFVMISLAKWLTIRMRNWAILATGFLVLTSTEAVQCVPPCFSPEVRSVQSSGVDTLALLLVFGVCL